MAYVSGPLGTTISVAFTSSSVANSTGFSSFTHQVRLAATAPCHYSIGDGAQTATATGAFLPNTVVEYVTVSPSQTIAAIRSSGGVLTSADGTLYVTEIG